MLLIIKSKLPKRANSTTKSSDFTQLIDRKYFLVSKMKSKTLFFMISYFQTIDIPDVTRFTLSWHEISVNFSVLETRSEQK